MTTPRPRTRAFTAALAATALLVGGCSAADLPLPGGAEVGGTQITVRADFADVLDLVPRSSVKLDEVTIGEVTDIELNGWTARVTMRIPASAKLPDDASAELKQTSLLGEKYVALVRPQGTGTGALEDGDLIPLTRTGRNPEVEEVLAAMSLLLNGGGVAQLKIIESELNTALRGNHEEVRSLIDNLNTFIGGLDEQKAEIIRAIEGIDRLSARLAERKDELAAVLEETPKGLKILADQREQLTTMLTSLGRLGKVGSTVIRASREDTLANLAALKPILGQLNAAGDDLPRSLELLLTYPFPDAATGAVKGDYTNLHVTGDFDLSAIEVLPQPTLPVPTTLPTVPLPTLPIPSLPIPSLPIPSLPVPTITVPTIPGVPLPTPTNSGILCPPLCSQAEQDRSWETLYTGGTS